MFKKLIITAVMIGVLPLGVQAGGGGIPMFPIIQVPGLAWLAGLKFAPKIITDAYGDVYCYDTLAEETHDCLARTVDKLDEHRKFINSLYIDVVQPDGVALEICIFPPTQGSHSMGELRSVIECLVNHIVKRRASIVDAAQPLEETQTFGEAVIEGLQSEIAKKAVEAQKEIEAANKLMQCELKVIKLQSKLSICKSQLNTCKFSQKRK
jgi:hypothetical protein